MPRCRRSIFSESTRPDSCIINFYSAGDCIPPHIDHHDFTRPFVTLSLLSEQDILFGQNIKVVNDGEFDAPFALPLPKGSVLVLDGNGANVAKHCVPSVRTDRVSITFRRIGAHIRMRPFAGPYGEVLPLAPSSSAAAPASAVVSPRASAERVGLSEKPPVLRAGLRAGHEPPGEASMAAAPMGAASRASDQKGAGTGPEQKGVSTVVAAVESPGRETAKRETPDDAAKALDEAKARGAARRAAAAAEDKRRKDKARQLAKERAAARAVVAENVS